MGRRAATAQATPRATGPPWREETREPVNDKPGACTVWAGGVLGVGQRAAGTLASVVGRDNEARERLGVAVSA